MSRPNENQRNRAVGMLQAGMAQNTVARHFGVHQNTIQSLWKRVHVAFRGFDQLVQELCVIVCASKTSDQDAQQFAQYNFNVIVLPD
uniref:Uncharacterized protein n=1 Tax=Magallana gigas TaxID=29159 RepID=K1Q8N0_MAGGI